MRLQELIAAIETFAPPAHAEPWDNVGLLVGDPAKPCRRVLLTIDYSDQVAKETRVRGCDTVIAYHPPIFQGLKKITSGGPTLAVFEAIRDQIAIYSPHTALDAARGGTHDVLADAIGLKERQPIRFIETKSTQYKLVFFVPEKDLEAVRSALFTAGAGRIGNYSSCSFSSSGKGTFFGEEGTSPAVGESGKLEENPEVRVETIVPISKLTPVLAALREHHPYEEPAFDLNQLAAAPEGVGQGRIGTLPEALPVSRLIERLKQKLSLKHLLVSGSESNRVRKVAICCGAGGEFLNDCVAQGAEVYITGEMRHHDVLTAAQAGMTVICTLHSNSERLVLKALKARLQKSLPGIEFILSRRDRDPFLIR